MLDVMLLGILSWAALYGWIRGGLKTLISLSVVVGILIGIWMILPGLNILVDHIQTKELFYNWLQNFLEPIKPVIKPVETYIYTLGMHHELETKLRYMYIRALIMSYLLAIIIGFVIIFNSLNMICENEFRQKTGTYTGLITGIIAGLYIDSVLVKLLVTLTWIYSITDMSNWIRSSLFAAIWLHTYRHGIFF